MEDSLGKNPIMLANAEGDAPKNAAWRLLRVAIVLHRAGEITFRIFEENEGSDARDGHFVHDDFPPIGFHRGRHTIDRLHRYRAFESVHSLAFDKFTALLHRALNAGVVLVAGENLKESGRPPGLKIPAEDVFVKRSGALQIVRVDGEVCKVGRHGFTVG